jgi:tetratricopeptide (TPR) repeat protein
MTARQRICPQPLRLTWWVLPLLAVLAASECQAQSRMNRPSSDEDEFFSKPLDGSSEQELKTPTMFLRPSQTTPAAQLAFARSLESDGSVRRARRAYDALVHRWHSAPEAPVAQLSVARMREKAGKMLRAFAEYQYAVDYFSGHFAFDDVLDRQFAIANQLRGDLDKGFLGFGREAGADEVVALFRHIARNAPAWHRAPECYLMMGLTFEAEDRFDEAVTPYETLATRYPGNKLVESAMFRAAACRYRLATKNPRDEMTLRNALSSLAATRRDYPDHPEMAQVLQWTDELRGRLTHMHHERAAFYDRIRKNPAAAVVAYGEFLRMFPNAEEAAAVGERIAVLTPRAAQQVPSTDPEDTP